MIYIVKDIILIFIMILMCVYLIYNIWLKEYYYHWEDKNISNEIDSEHEDDGGDRGFIKFNLRILIKINYYKKKDKIY